MAQPRRLFRHAAASLPKATAGQPFSVLSWPAFIRNPRPESIFLALGLVFGLVFVVVFPPYQVPDEPVHLYRAYTISRGSWFDASGPIPASLTDLHKTTVTLPFQPNRTIQPDLLFPYWTRPLNPEVDKLENFHTTTAYSPLPYTLTALASLVARTFEFSPLAFFYFVRGFNLLGWLILCYTALRITPILKWVFAALMLTPMSLQQAASASPDALTNGAALLFTAVCLHLAFGTSRKLGYFEYFLLLGFTIFMALTKAPYVFLMGLYLLISPSRYPSRKHFLTFSAAILGIGFVMFVFSALFGKSYVQDSSFRPDQEVNSMTQVFFILENPIAFLMIYFRTISGYLFDFWATYIGFLGWLDTRLPSIVYYSYLPFLVLTALFDTSPNIRIQWLQRLVGLGVFFVIALVLGISMFIAWTPSGSDIIKGLQGRYYIPAVPAAFLAVSFPFLRWNRVAALGFALYLALILLITVKALLSRYYGIALL